MQNLPTSIQHLFPAVVGGVFSLAPSGESSQTAAQAIVSWVGGLCVGVTGPGAERATSDVEFHEALRPGREIVVQSWRRQVGALMSVADAHRGHIMLFVDSGAQFYAFTDPDSRLYALGSFGRAMETLLLGLDLGLPLEPDAQSFD